MPKYTIATPDGRKVTVEAANEAAALSGVRAWHAKNPRTMTAVNGAIAAFGEGLFPFYNEASAAIGTPFDMAGDAFSGKKVDAAQSYKDLLSRFEGNQAAFTAAHPKASALTTGVGMAAPVAATLGAGLLPGVASKAAPVAAQVAPGLLSRMGQSAAVGGAYGAAYGAGQPGSIEDRLRGASGGATTGVITGAAIPPAISAAMGVGGRVVGVRRGVARMANKSTGGNMLDPNTEALKRLREAMLKDGFTPEKIRAVMGEWQKSGLSPTLLDVVSEGGGGQYTRRMIRMAASKAGPAANLATEYATGAREGLGSKMQDALAPLSPRKVGTQAAIDNTTKARKRLADYIFKSVGDDSVVITPEMERVLSTDVGKSAVQDALKVADQRALRTGLAKDRAVAVKLHQLSRGSEDTSVAASDMVRRVIADKETAMATKDMARTASGEATALRNQFVSGVKAQSPEYAKGMEVLSGAHGRTEAYDIGSKILTMQKDDFAAAVAKMTESDKRAALLAAKNAMQAAAGNTAGGGYGVSGRLSYAPDVQERLALITPKADAIVTAARRTADQVRNAQFVAPNTNSQTFGRELDQAEFSGAIPTSKIGMIKALMDKIQSGISLTDAERLAIVRFSQAQPSASRGVFVGAEDITGPQTRGLLDFMALPSAQYIGAQAGVRQGTGNR